MKRLAAMMTAGCNARDTGRRVYDVYLDYIFLV